MRQLALTIDEPGLALSARPSALNHGSLTEMIVYEGGAIQPMHLLPLLAQCSAQQRWLFWFSAHLNLNKEWLESLGLGNAAVVHMNVRRDNQLSLCTRALAAQNSHMIIEWQGELTHSERLHIRELAMHSGSHVVVIQRLP